MFVMPFIDSIAAKRLSWILKTLLGVEAIVDLIILAYGTVLENSELLINLYKLSSTNHLFRQCLQSWTRGTDDLWARCLFIGVYSFGIRVLVRLIMEILDISDSNIGPFQWYMKSYLWL